MGKSRPIYRRLRLPDSDIRVLLQRTDDEKVSKERMHLDLETDDVEAEVRRLKRSVRPVGITSKSVALTSGSCGTRRATSSAFSRLSSLSCWPGVGHGLLAPSVDIASEVNPARRRR